MAQWRRGALWLVATGFVAFSLLARQTHAASPEDHGDRPELSRSQCPGDRGPIPIGNPRLVRFWEAAVAFDRIGHGFSALPTEGDVVFEYHPDARSAVIHTCQFGDRVYRTIHFRLDPGSVRWIGEQQSYRSGRVFEDSDAGTLLEELVLDYEAEPVAGFPLHRLNTLYHGPATGGAGPSASPSLDQARTLLRRWGFQPVVP